MGPRHGQNCKCRCNDSRSGAQTIRWRMSPPPLTARVHARKHVKERVERFPVRFGGIFRISRGHCVCGRHVLGLGQPRRSSLASDWGRRMSLTQQLPTCASEFCFGRRVAQLGHDDVAVQDAVVQLVQRCCRTRRVAVDSARGPQRVVHVRRVE